MSGLTREARALVEDGKGDLGPSAEVRARLKSRVLEEVGSPRSAAGEREAAVRSVIGGRSLAQRLLIIAAIGIGAASVTVLSRTTSGGAEGSSSVASRIESTPASPNAPSSSALAGPVEKTPPPADEVPAVVRRPDELPAAPTEHKIRVEKPSERAILGGRGDDTKGGHATMTDSLDAEMRLIAAAQSALDDDNRVEARRNLEEHAHLFPRGILREERSTLRVRLLCAEGKVDDAKRAARELEAEHPRSSHLAVLRASCAGAKD